MFLFKTCREYPTLFRTTYSIVVCLDLTRSGAAPMEVKMKRSADATRCDASRQVLILTKGAGYLVNVTVWYGVARKLESEQWSEQEARNKYMYVHVIWKRTEKSMDCTSDFQMQKGSLLGVCRERPMSSKLQARRSGCRYHDLTDVSAMA